MNASALLRARRLARWPSGPALFAGAFAIALTPATDGDVWWHLASGREIAKTRSFLMVDPFSVSAGGRPWIDVHWLFQLAAYGVFCLGGLGALVAGKALLVATGAFFLGKTVERDSGRRAALGFAAAFVGALFAARSLLLLRPIVVTLFLLAFFYMRLERFRREGRWRALVALPLAQVVWANSQGLFAIGPAFVAAYLLGEWLETSSPLAVRVSQEAKPRAPRVPSFLSSKSGALAATLALCALACCATPYGVRALALPFELLGRLIPGHGNVYAANVVENASPLTSGQALGGPFWHLPWFLALLAVSFALAGRRVVMAHALVVAAFVMLALVGNRNVLLLYWMATPIAVMNGWPAARRVLELIRRRRIAGALARWGARAAWAALAVFIIGAAWGETALARPAPFRAPTESARILAERPGTGTIFAADEYGGYVIWKLYPRYRPYIDTRLVLRTAAEFAEYLGVADHPERFDDFQAAHGFDYVLLPVAYPDRYLGLVAHLYGSPRWKLVFTDGAETLFARQDIADLAGWDMGSTETTSRVLGAIETQFGEPRRVRDVARLGLATLDVALGEFGQAERVLSEISSPEALALLARMRLASGDLAGARTLGERLSKSDARDARSLNLLALVSMRQGQPRSALSFLRRALAADPFDVEAERILSSLEEHAYAH